VVGLFRKIDDPEAEGGTRRSVERHEHQAQPLLRRETRVDQRRDSSIGRPFGEDGEPQSLRRLPRNHVQRQDDGGEPGAARDEALGDDQPVRTHPARARTAEEPPHRSDEPLRSIGHWGSRRFGPRPGAIHRRDRRARREGHRQVLAAQLLERLRLSVAETGGTLLLQQGAAGRDSRRETLCGLVGTAEAVELEDAREEKSAGQVEGPWRLTLEL
jgi:hypothetical protein